MVFSSIIFLCVFLPVMIIGYYILPKKLKNVFLLLGSLFFYAWAEPKYVILIVAAIIGNYGFGLLIARFAKQATEKKASILKKAAMITAVVFNLGILIYFKYFVLLVTTINSLSGAKLSIPEIILPIGISFYVFKSISYIVDVYRIEGTVDTNGETCTLVEKNPIDFALYVSMFPEIMSGPISRYKDVKVSIKEHVLTVSSFTAGTERFIIGLAKKAIIANGIGEVADKIFSSNIDYMGTPVAWLGAILYTLQIYHDFAGYSDMAIGLGKIFGYDLMENFNYPYISQSITEFWRRWHISLSRWFRDYLYIPLGGNRKGNVYFNLFVVFLATGIWHGAAWGFLIWGLWHGLFMLIERVLKSKNLKWKIPSFIKWLYTMLVVTFGWVLFKLEEIGPTLDYMGVMFHTKVNSFTAFSLRYYLDNKTIFLLVLAVIVTIPWAQILPRRLGSAIAAVSIADSGSPAVIVKRILLLLLLLLSMMFIVNSTYSPFIYFKF